MTHPEVFRPSGLRVLKGREASMFASVADAIVCPNDGYPSIGETSAAYFFDDFLARSSPANRLALRSLVWLAELAPLVLGFRKRLRRLERAERERFVGYVDASSNPLVMAGAGLMKLMATMSYYGDDRLLAIIGHDPEALLERGRRLRAEEGRP